MEESAVRAQSDFPPAIEARVRKFKVGEEPEDCEEETTAEERWKTMEEIRRAAWQFKAKGITEREPKFYRIVRKIRRSQS